MSGSRVVTVPLPPVYISTAAVKNGVWVPPSRLSTAQRALSPEMLRRVCMLPFPIQRGSPWKRPVILNRLAHVGAASERYRVPLDDRELMGLVQTVFWPLEDDVALCTLGAVTAANVFCAVLQRHRVAMSWFGDLHLPHIATQMMSEELAVVRDGPLRLALNCGTWEAGAGWKVELSTVGFQETADAVDIVLYQGEPGREHRVAFRRYAGGVDPCLWLAYFVGRHLSRRAATIGVPLRWIKGERLLWGYPHADCMIPDLTADDALTYWHRPHPEIEAAALRYDPLQSAIRTLEQRIEALKRSPSPTAPLRIARLEDRWRGLMEEFSGIKELVEMHRAGPTIAARYDRTAENLGFRRLVDGAWHCYEGAVERFGETMRSAVRNRDLFDAQIASMDKAVQSAVSSTGAQFFDFPSWPRPRDGY